MRDWLLRGVYWCGSECTLLGTIVTGGKRFLPSQIALAIGLSYLFVPIDLIPDRTPLIGHLDELAFLVCGFLAAHKLSPAGQKPLRAGAAGASRPARTAAGAGLPNFFIVGAPRCGTTSLFAALGLHPDIFCCPVKEPNHFATDRNAKPSVIASAMRRGALLTAGAPGMAVLPRVATTPDFDTYLHLFDGWAGQRAVGEASTSYLFSRTAAGEIARRRPDARIIVVLRQPAERALSEYQMHAQLGRKMGSTDPDGALVGGFDDQDAISLSSIIAASLYAPQIERYLKVFGREQMLFLRFEDLAGAPAEALRSVFRHLGVDPDPCADIRLSQQNQSRAVRFPMLNRVLFTSGLRDVILHAMPGSVRRRLAKRYYAAGSADLPAVPLDLFRADIAATERLTGLDLSAWVRG